MRRVLHSVRACWRAWTLGSALLVGGVATAAEIGPVQICEDANEWPPYTYLERQGSRAELRGFSVELARAVLDKHHIAYKIELLPWQRCLREVAEGQRFQMLLNAAATPEREQQYLLSLPYHQTHSHIFFLSSRFAQGFKPVGAAELQRYTLGGVRGYAYPQLSAAQRESMLRTGNYAALLRMLRLGRVDLLVEDVEPLLGMARLGLVELPGDPAVGHVPLAGSPATSYHMLFTRQRPQGAALQALFNAELREMQASGELARRLARYLGS